MSDKIRPAAGALLVVTCAALCLIPAVLRKPERADVYRSGECLRWTLKPIDTEKNGEILVNEAEAEELTSLYGVGETLASMIVEERLKNGPFFYAEDLEAVRGIGRKTLDRFRPMIDLSMDESEE